MPQATMMILSMALRRWGSMFISSSTSLPSSSVRPSRVSAMALGCSRISFSMKDECPPFSAASASQVTSNLLPWAGVPSKPMTCTSSGVMTTSWSWSTSMADLV